MCAINCSEGSVGSVIMQRKHMVTKINCMCLWFGERKGWSSSHGCRKQVRCCVGLKVLCCEVALKQCNVTR